MRTSFFIGLGLVVSLAGSARPQAKSFHLYQQSIRGTLGYGLDGRYTVRPHEIVVTIGDGPVVAHQTVTLHSLRLGICGSSNIFSQELLLNDVSLKPHDSYKLPSATIKIPLPKQPPTPSWLCSTLLESNGGYHVARDTGPPILGHSVATHQGTADIKSNEVSEARTILHQAALVAETIPNDPPRPPEVLRIAYYDPLYGPEKRENTLVAIAQAEAKAVDLEGILHFVTVVGNGDARDSIIDTVAIARATTGNPETALQAIGGLPEERKQRLLYQFGLARARAGDAAGALHFASSITNEATKGPLLVEIAGAQAKAGDVPGALQTTDAITATDANARDSAGRVLGHTAQKIQALLAIADAQEKAGDRAGAGHTLKRAQGLVSADSSLRENDRSTLGTIAQAEAMVGQFKEALETARSIPFDVPRGVVFATIAGSQAKAGDVQGALQTVQAIQGEDHDFWKAIALARIGKVQASQGDQAGATETFQNAVRTVESISGQSMAYFRGWRLAAIAKAQAQSGEGAASVATFEKALNSARAMPDPRAGTVNYQAYSKDMLFSLIAKAQAEVGLVKDALKTAGEIRVLPDKSRERGWGGGDPKVTALYEIARAQGLRVEPREAVAWVETVQVPTEKAFALLGLAEGLLGPAGAESVEPQPDEI